MNACPTCRQMLTKRRRQVSPDVVCKRHGESLHALHVATAWRTVQVQGPTGQEGPTTLGRIEHRGCGCREVVETAGDRRSFTIANMVELVSTTGKGETAATAGVEDAKQFAVAVDLADATTNKVAAYTVICDDEGHARQM